MKFLIISLFLSLCFIACGDDVLFSPNDKKSISNHFFLLKNGDTSIEGKEPIDTIFVQPEETLYVRTAAHFQDKYISSNELEKYFFVRFWIYKGFMVDGELLRTVWDSPKKDSLCHFSIDMLGDSLKHCIPVFINSPASIQLQSPENAKNDFQYSDTITFQWKTFGVDSWETSYCDLFISESPRSLWTTNPISVSCFEPHKLNSKKIISDSSDLPLLYWGIRFKTNSEDTTEILYSEPRHFRFMPKDSAAVFAVPIVYENARSHEKKGILQIYSKDSLIHKLNFSKDTVFYLKNFTPGEKYRFIVSENLRTDYFPDTLEAFLEPKLITTTDTLILKDKISPEAIPLKKVFNASDSIKFYAAENGSGLNALRSSVTVLESNDTIPYKFSKDQFAFSFHCESLCHIQIHLEDNAKNSSPKKIWKVQFTDKKTFVQGPYSAGDFL